MASDGWRLIHFKSLWLFRFISIKQRWIGVREASERMKEKWGWFFLWSKTDKKNQVSFCSFSSEWCNACVSSHSSFLLTYIISLSLLLFRMKTFTSRIVFWLDINTVCASSLINTIVAMISVKNTRRVNDLLNKVYLFYLFTSMPTIEHRLHCLFHNHIFDAQSVLTNVSF